MKCSICGCENEENVTTCAQCGNALTAPAPQTFCRHCGKQIRPTAKFCVYCGARQAEEPAAENPVPEAEAAPAVIPEPQPVAEPEVAEAPEVAAEVAAEVVAEAAAQPQPVPQPAVSTRPALQLPTGRSLAKMFWLGLITLGIYDVAILSRIPEEMNITSSRYDGKRTQQFWWMTVLMPLTLGIYPLVWIHGLCNRIGDALTRRSLSYKFSAASFWTLNVLWPICISIVGGIAAGVLAALGTDIPRFVPVIVLAATVIGACVTPFVFVHKLMRAMNLINADYNENG